MASPSVGAVGLPLRLAVVDENGEAIPLTSATTKKIRLKSPQPTPAVEFDAELVEDTENVLVYVTTADDLPVPGEYRMQARVVTPDFADHSSVFSFEVLRPL